jgi:hypothetical protein
MRKPGCEHQALYLRSFQLRGRTAMYRTSFLSARGADLGAKDRDGKTPLGEYAR